MCPFSSVFGGQVPSQIFTLAIKPEERTMLNAFKYIEERLLLSSFVFLFPFPGNSSGSWL